MFGFEQSSVYSCINASIHGILVYGTASSSYKSGILRSELFSSEVGAAIEGTEDKSFIMVTAAHLYWSSFEGPNMLSQIETVEYMDDPPYRFFIGGIGACFVGLYAPESCSKSALLVTRGKWCAERGGAIEGAES